METSAIFYKYAPRRSVNAFLYTRLREMPIRASYHILSLCVVISNKFPRLLAEREIIANALVSPDFSPNRRQRYKLICKSALNYEKRCIKIVFGWQKWLVSPSKPTNRGSKNRDVREKCLSLQW